MSVSGNDVSRQVLSLIGSLTCALAEPDETRQQRDLGRVKEDLEKLMDEQMSLVAAHSCEVSPALSRCNTSADVRRAASEQSQFPGRLVEPETDRIRTCKHEPFSRGADSLDRHLPTPDKTSAKVFRTAHTESTTC